MPEQTYHARILCDCGEWIYTEREKEGGVVSFPKSCRNCGRWTPDDASRPESDPVKGREGPSR